MYQKYAKLLVWSLYQTIRKCINSSHSVDSLVVEHLLEFVRKFKKSYNTSESVVLSTWPTIRLVIPSNYVPTMFIWRCSRTNLKVMPITRALDNFFLPISIIILLYKRCDNFVWYYLLIVWALWNYYVSLYTTRLEIAADISSKKH